MQCDLTPRNSGWQKNGNFQIVQGHKDIRLWHADRYRMVQVVPNHHLNECLVLEINFNNKKGYDCSFPLSFSKWDFWWIWFISYKFRKPFSWYIFSLLLGDFNAKLKTWYINDQPTTEGTQLESFIWLYGTKQLKLTFEKISQAVRSYFCEPTKFDNGLRNTSNSPLQIPSSNFPLWS